MRLSFFYFYEILTCVTVISQSLIFAQEDESWDKTCIVFIVGTLFRDGIKNRKVLLFGDELRVNAGEKSVLTLRADVFYILEQASWVKK